MGYEKNKDDNGRIEGTFEDFTTEHVVGKFDYGKKDVDESVEVEREVTEDD